MQAFAVDFFFQLLLQCHAVCTDKRRQPAEGLANNNESLLLIGPAVASKTQPNPLGSCISSFWDAHYRKET